MDRWLVVALATVLALATVPAFADLVVFTDEAAFLDAAGTLGFESFENTEPGFTGTSRVLDEFLVGAVDPFDFLEVIDNPAFAADGEQSLGNARGIGFFGFNEVPNTFGFTVYDFGNAGANTLELWLGDSEGFFAVLDLAADSDPFEPFRFFGVISSRPFTTVELHHNNAEDFLTVDAIRFGHTVIPEPGTLGLVVAGLAGLAFRIRAKARRFSP